MKELTDKQVENAIRLNRYYTGLKFKILGDNLAARKMNQLSFVRWVVEFQREHGLVPDGVFGPRTLSAWYAAGYGSDLLKKTRVVDYLLMDGKKIKVPFQVIGFNEMRGMSFYDFPRCWRPRSRKIVDAFILHWDVCSSSQSCFQSLIGRGLSVHLMLDWDGMIYQALDLMDVAYHAAPNNNHSIGVEINNPYYLGKNNRGRPIAEMQLKPNSKAYHRHVDFTDMQKKRVVQLCDAVCGAMNIRKELPRIGRKSKKAEDVLTSVWHNSPGDSRRISAWLSGGGVFGHYHLNERKIDPGLTLWKPLVKAGY